MKITIQTEFLGYKCMWECNKPITLNEERDSNCNIWYYDRNATIGIHLNGSNSIIKPQENEYKVWIDKRKDPILVKALALIIHL